MSIKINDRVNAKFYIRQIAGSMKEYNDTGVVTGFFGPDMVLVDIDHPELTDPEPRYRLSSVYVKLQNVSVIPSKTTRVSLVFKTAMHVPDNDGMCDVTMIQQGRIRELTQRLIKESLLKAKEILKAEGYNVYTDDVLLDMVFKN